MFLFFSLCAGVKFSYYNTSEVNFEISDPGTQFSSREFKINLRCIFHFFCAKLQVEQIETSNFEQKP